MYFWKNVSTHRILANMKDVSTLLKNLVLLCCITLVLLPVVLSQQNNYTTSQQALLDSAQAKIDFFYYSQWDSVLHYAELVQPIFQKEQQWKDYVGKFNDVAVSAFYCNQIEVCKQYLDSAKTTAERYAIDENSLEWVTILQTQAAYFYKKGNYTLAVENMEEGIQRLRKGATIDSAALQVAFISLSTFYKDKGDFDKGIEAAQRALQYTSKFKDLNVAALYNNLGLNYYNKFQFEEAQSNYKKAEQLYQSFLDHQQYANYASRNLSQVYNNMATNFSKNEQYDSALFYLQKNIASSSSKRKDQMYHNMSFAYYSKGDYNKAEYYIKQSIAHKKQRKKFPKIADNHNLWAKIEMARGNYSKALEYLQISLTAVLLPFNEQEDYFQHPELYDILSERKLLATLELRGDAFGKYYHQSNQVKYLEGAYTSYKLATRLIEQTRRSYKAEGSKRFLSERAVPIFEKAINTAYQLHQITKDKVYIEQAFEFTEKSKAVLLLAHLKEAEAKEFAGVHDTLIQEEQRLKAELAYNEREYQRAKRNKDTLKANLFQEALFEIGESYDYFIAQLEQDYPDYYQLKYDDAVASITSLQQERLNDSTALMEFFIGEEIITLFSITQQNTYIKQIQKPDNFDITIFEFRRSLSDLEFIKDSLQVALQQFGHTAHQLHNWLLDSAIIHNTSIKSLVIIPDGIIGHLPFEVFLSKPIEADDNFQTLSYLIHQYDISYSYSGTFLQQIKKKDRYDYKNTYGGFAATYATNATLPQDDITRDGLADLPNATKEVQQIADITGGDAWIGKEATEERFKSIASNYQILHFSMHGLLDDGNPLFSHLLFTENETTEEDDELTVLEIYNLKLEADLAVLSACNTGFGQIDKGEGVMSLSRAFAYAGCPSIVMSLWSVPDKSTSDIMVDFFKNFKKTKNITKSAALRQAKLAYLDDSDVLLAHPVFWAGFVSMGDTTPIEWADSSFSIWWYIGIGVLLIMGAFLLWKIKSKSA